MSENTVETTATDTTVEGVVVESKKKFNFTRKHLAYAAAGLTAAVAATAIVLKVKSGDFEDLTVGDLDVVESVTDAISG